MEEYSEAKELIPFGQTPMETNIDDEIKLYKPKKKNRNEVLYSACFKVWRFLLLVVAFFMVYYCLYQLYLKNALHDEDILASASPEQTVAEETAVKSEFKLPLIIDESGKETNLDLLFNEDSRFRLPPGDGIKVIIVNSHSSERVAADITVAEISEDLLKLLQSNGISAYLDDTVYDSEGAIGAYSRMSENVVRMKDIYKEAVVVIDLHDSDSGVPFTFTLGASDSFAWQENLRFACAIYKLMKCPDAAFRFLPIPIGQDNGLLNVNIGIGGSDCSGIEARGMISQFANALVQVLKNEPLE